MVSGIGNRKDSMSTSHDSVDKILTQYILYIAKTALDVTQNGIY